MRISKRFIHRTFRVVGLIALVAILAFTFISSDVNVVNAQVTLCGSPTTITGGGTFSITTAGTCFKYVNTAFVRGGMFSVMKDGTATTDTLKWYGGLDQNVTACANQSSTISGNGGQLNNFTVAKDSSGAMYLQITGSAANSVTISITNWQNGNGCSTAPTPVTGGTNPTTAPTNPPATATRTNTPLPTSTTCACVPTATRTNTTVPPTTAPTTVPTTGPTQPPASGGLQTSIKNNGAETNQQTPFAFTVKNTSTAAKSGITVRIYFNTDNGNAATNYTMEKYYDQSGVATIVAPTLVSGSTYYFTINYGTASLAAGAQWEFQTAMHLANWGTNYDGTNDHYHTGYALNALPAAYTVTNYIPAYVSGTLAWGVQPGGTVSPTSTTVVVPTNTQAPTTVGATATKSNTPVPTTVGATATRTPTKAPTAVPTNGPTPIPGTHVDNPFVGAKVYLNVDYVNEVKAAAAAKGGTLGAKMAQVANFPTFVWLDSIDAVNGTNGYGHSLAGHMDAALAQGANAFELVVYDLPNRDCSALASNGELLIAQDGFNKYKTLYIDAIYATISQAKYANMRVIAVIEPDSLPNLVTNLNSFAKCQEANGPGGYVDGIRYALNKLGSLSNFYSYIDIGHHGWLGWSSNFNPAVTLIANAIKGTTKGVNSIDGFISDTANTTALKEIYMTANQMISGNPVRSANYHQWNDYIDEDTYDTAWRNAMIAAGFPSTIGMVVDTSRNGWGGTARPTGPSTSTDLNTFVNAGRIDRRIHKGNWCNQDGAGIGERPVAAPAAGFDAYVWVKPPGESDGSSTLIPTGPDNPGGKGFDRMCDPTYTGNSLNGNSMTGALPNAPVSGRWFEFQFEQLVTNAFPAFQ